MVDDEFQKHRQLIPPGFEIAALLGHAGVEFSLRAFADRVIYVDYNLVEDFR